MNDKWKKQEEFNKEQEVLDEVQAVINIELGEADAKLQGEITEQREFNNLVSHQLDEGVSWFTFIFVNHNDFILITSICATTIKYTRMDLQYSPLKGKSLGP